MMFRETPIIGLRPIAGHRGTCATAAVGTVCVNHFANCCKADLSQVWFWAPEHSFVMSSGHGFEQGVFYGNVSGNVSVRNA